MAQLPCWPSGMFLMTYGLSHAAPAASQHYVSISVRHVWITSSALWISETVLICLCEGVYVWNTVGRETRIKNARQHTVMLIHSDIKDLLFPCVCVPGLMGNILHLSNSAENKRNEMIRFLFRPIRTRPQSAGWWYRLPTNERRTRWPSR